MGMEVEMLAVEGVQVEVALLQFPMLLILF
jgi:hypothetical protein